MPTYEYVCNQCGFTFEEFQSIKAEPLTTCPQCKGDIRRLISGGSGLLFKGSGFYETDYKPKKSAPPKTDSGPEKSSKKAS